MNDNTPRGPQAIPWVTMVATASAYTVGSLFAFLVLNAPAAIAVLFPPAGVSLTALVLSPRRHWPWVLATVFVTEIAIDLWHGLTPGEAVGFASANTLEPLVGALLLRLILPGAVDLTTRLDLRAFLLCAVVIGPFVGALIGATTITVSSSTSWLGAFPLFWAGDAMGVLTVGGALLTSRFAMNVEVRWLLLGGLLAATSALTVVSFLPDTLPLFYLPLPLLLWIALRFGVPELTSAGLVFTLTANVITARGRGPWGELVGSQQGTAASLQLFLAVAILAGWLLAVGIRERERAARLLELEHESAVQLQRALLPTVPTRLPGVSIDALYRPADIANEVGGDWYDAFPLGDGRIGIAVGDVVGHELRAAVTMGRLHTIVRLAAATPGAGPAAILSALDEACAVIPDALCATAGYAEYTPATGELRYACAGHPPPLLVPTDGPPSWLSEGRSAPLGVTDIPRTEAATQIPPGASLIWYSDGLVERRDENIDEGLSRLAAAAEDQRRATDSGAWSEAILAVMTGASPLGDDVIVICVRLDGVSPETDQGPLTTPRSSPGG